MSSTNRRRVEPGPFAIFGDFAGRDRFAAQKGARLTVPPPRYFRVNGAECEISIIFTSELDTLPANHGYSEFREGVHVRIRPAGPRAAS